MPGGSGGCDPAATAPAPEDGGGGGGLPGRPSVISSPRLFRLVGADSDRLAFLPLLLVPGVLELTSGCRTLRKFIR